MTMAELDDVTTTDAVVKQFEMYGNSLELMADNLQDLKKHLMRNNDNKQFNKQIDVLNTVQNMLYQSSDRLYEVTE